MAVSMIRAFRCALVALLLTQSVAVSVSASSRLSSDASESLSERPVMKVVRLLQDMKAELEAELADDQAVHEKLDCWCKANDKEKTAAIEQGEATSAQLTASMSEEAAKIAELKAKRKATMDEIQADDAALRSANDLRIKENKDFHEQETYLLEAIDACKQAIVVLGVHHPAFAQVKQVAQLLQKARVTDFAATTGTSLSKVDAGALKDFLRNVQSASSFLSIPGFQSYTPQSGQIFGILQQMLEDFKVDLADAQKAEGKAQGNYDELKATKKDEIALGDATVEKIDQDLADSEEKHAEEAKQLQDTQDQLALDREFLANLKQKCAESDAEFDKRVKSRHEEIIAVEDTIKILNDDEAFAVFDKTVSTAFIQVSSSTDLAKQNSMRQRAMKVLQEAAKESGAPQLALLAAHAKLDAFTKVKEEIDKLVAELTRQQSDEVDHKDWCVSEFAANDRAVSKATDKKESLEIKSADLKKNIAAFGKSIKELTDAIAEMKNQMKRASETREAEYADFQQTIMDQRLTQTILKKAIARMQQVYAMLQQREEPAPGAPHIETSGNHTDPGNGPARFTAYEKNAGGSRVIRMLQTVLSDSLQTEDEAIAAEEDAQVAYESFIKDGNKDITKKSETIQDLSKAKATAEVSLNMAQEDLKATMADLDGLDKVKTDLHGSCDFILKNFDARQEARAKEIDALKEAKAILSGMQ